MDPQTWPSVPFAALGKGTGVSWPYIEQTKGHFNWNRLDEFVNLAKAHGVSILFSGSGVPPWAAADKSTCHTRPPFGSYCSSDVSNMRDWENFVTAMVTRYKGEIQAYELWNEPQNSFTGTLAQFIALTQREHDIIRSIDPGATILSPSTISYGAPFLDSYLANGGTRDIDAVAFHGYPDPTNDVAEAVIVSMTTTILSVMSKYGLSSKALWDTEGSWGSASSGAIIDPNLQAAFVARYYLLHWSVGISRLYWYGWDNNDIGTLWHFGRAPSKAATAYVQVRDWMLGATMTRPCSSDNAPSAYSATYTCDFKRSGGYQARAVWNTNGDRSYLAPDRFTRYRGLAGDKYPIRANHEVQIGLKPILLESFSTRK
jgi:polysaccharide biosynthesis protein PslG